MKTLLTEIYNTFESYKQCSEAERSFYDLHINFLIQDEPTDIQKNYLTYWESLKRGYNQYKEVKYGKN